MKKLILILFLLCLGISAQDKETKPVGDNKKTETSESSDEKKKTIAIVSSDKTEKERQKFEDKDGDGINDIMQGKQKRRGRTDNFVDKDGDGINDNRVQGMGWSGGRKHKGFGKHKK